MSVGVLLIFFICALIYGGLYQYVHMQIKYKRELAGYKRISLELADCRETLRKYNEKNNI